MKDRIAIYFVHFYQEYYDKCTHSENLLTSQITWASSQAERLKELGDLPPETLADPPHPKSEKLLEAILAANHEVMEAIRIYDDLKRMGEEALQEREVAERSKRDVRLDRTVCLCTASQPIQSKSVPQQIEYVLADGSYQMQVPGGNAGGASGPSRTPSPGLDPPPTGLYSHNGSQPSLNSSSQNHSQSGPASQNYLGLPGLPRAVPHGPRRPMPRSRSPSPERGADNHYYSRSNYLDIDRSSSRLTREDSSDELEVTVRPSTKAMGKRRLETSPERSETGDSTRGDEGGHSRTSSFSDSDESRIRPHWNNRPQAYVYDAMAERSKKLEEERQRSMKDKG